MADDQQKGFVPIDPEQLNSGVFSSYLMPGQTPPIQPLQTSGYQKKGVGIAGVAEKFLEGMQRGKVMAFARQQQQKSQGWKQFNATISALRQDPRYQTPEAQQFLDQQVSQALGQYGQGVMGEQGKKGKKTKGGGGGSGQPEQGGQGVNLIGHVKNAASDLFKGMAGPTPKGLPDDPMARIGSIYTALNDPKNSSKYTIAGVSAGYQDKLKGIMGKYPPGTAPETIARDSDFTKLMTDWQRIDPQAASTAAGALQTAYPGTPSEASKLQALADWESQGSQQTPQIPGPPGVVTSPDGSSPSPPAAAPVSGQGGPAWSGRAMPASVFRYAQDMGMVSPENVYEYTDESGVTIPLHGNIVRLPRGSKFIDENGREVSVDVTKLSVRKDPIPKNLVSRDNKETLGVIYHPATGQTTMRDGSPLPAAWKDAAEESGIPRPLNMQPKKIGVQIRNGKLVDVWGDPYGYNPPDYRPHVGADLSAIKERYRLEDLRTVETLKAGIRKSTQSQRTTINRKWDTLTQNIDKQVPPPKNADELKAGYNRQKAAELAALDKQTQADIDSVSAPDESGAGDIPGPPEVQTGSGDKPAPKPAPGSAAKPKFEM